MVTCHRLTADVSSPSRQARSSRDPSREGAAEELGTWELTLMVPIQCHSMQDVQGRLTKRVPYDFRTVECKSTYTTRFAGQCSTGPSKHDATYPAFLRIGSTDARDHEEKPPNGNQCSHPETQHWLIDRDGVTPLARVLWSRHRIVLQAPSEASANRRLRSA